MHVATFTSTYPNILLSPDMSCPDVQTTWFAGMSAYSVLIAPGRTLAPTTVAFAANSNLDAFASTLCFAFSWRTSTSLRILLMAAPAWSFDWNFGNSHEPMSSGRYETVRSSASMSPRRVKKHMWWFADATSGSRFTLEVLY